jgi:hypothetical protein
MAQEKENFLSRWSRLKQESKDLPREKETAKTESAPPELPPVEKLTPESDFTGFMHPKVEDALRRVALKKLFSDPHFNVPDPFEAYSGDWTGGEPIPEEMLAKLNQAKDLIFKEPTVETKTGAPSEQAEDESKQAKDDEPGRKDA